jgi:hypothetical protein
MQALMQAVYDAVMEFYDHKKPWKQAFVKFTVKFDEQGRVVAITYAPFPPEHRDALLGASQRRFSTVWEEPNRRVGQRRGGIQEPEPELTHAIFPLAIHSYLSLRQT